MPQEGKNLHSPRTGRAQVILLERTDRQKSGEPWLGLENSSQVPCRWTVGPRRPPHLLDPAAPDSLRTFVSLVPEGKVLYNHFQSCLQELSNQAPLQNGCYHRVL